MSEGEKRLAESVSALVDGETDELEMQRVLNTLAQNKRKNLNRLTARVFAVSGLDTILCHRSWLTLH